MVNKAIKWTPKDNPTTNEMINNHLFPRGKCISASHRNPNQSSKAIKVVAIAYTSASTALNQKLSEKVKAKAPTKALPNMIKSLV